ncbi:MAG: adenosylmethionine decarboxylase [Planctomycetota bacterium]|jgi:S-adenosylmethionine decarboxylase
MSQPHFSPSFGTHVILDAWGADPALLNDPTLLAAAIQSAITAGRATLIDMCVHEFSPQGVTATATLKESHIAIHTWPEHGYAAADLFFCATGEPELAVQALINALEPSHCDIKRIKRGAGYLRQFRGETRKAGAS